MRLSNYFCSKLNFQRGNPTKHLGKPDEGNLVFADCTDRIAIDRKIKGIFWKAFEGGHAIIVEITNDNCTPRLFIISQ